MAITKKLTGHLSISTADYNSLINKPSINGIPLVGNVEIDVGESVDLSGLATKEEMQAISGQISTINSALENTVTESETLKIVEDSTADLATKAELSAAMDSVAPIPEETLTAAMNAVFSTADPV